MDLAGSNWIYTLLSRVLLFSFSFPVSVCIVFSVWSYAQFCLVQLSHCLLRGCFGVRESVYVWFNFHGRGGQLFEKHQGRFLKGVFFLIFYGGNSHYLLLILSIIVNVFTKTIIWLLLTVNLEGVGWLFDFEIHALNLSRVKFPVF